MYTIASPIYTPRRRSIYFNNPLCDRRATIIRSVHSKRIYDEIALSRGAFSKALSHFNDTVENHLIKRDGRWRLSYHPRDRSSVHYDAQNNCLTGWKDESRPVTLDYRSRRDAASEEQRDSREPTAMVERESAADRSFRCHPVVLGRQDKIKDSSATEPSAATVRHTRIIVKPADLVFRASTRKNCSRFARFEKL